MTDYTITTNFGAKDSLPSGNAGKVIKGSEFTTEFTNIQTAVNTKADTAGDTFTGAVTFDAAVTVNSTATITGDLTVDTNPLFVDATNDRVGIGTTSPAGNLHISAGTDGDATLILEADTDNIGSEADNPKLQLRQDGNIVRGEAYMEGESGATASGSVANAFVLEAKDSGGTNHIQFATGGTTGSSPTNGTVRMTVKNDGNVGIGTSSPQSDGNTTNLEVSSASGARVLVNNTDTSGRKYGIYSDNSGRFGFADYTADATRMLIDSSGNVLVGTTSATAMGTTNTGVVLRDNDSSYFARNSNGTIIAFFSGLGGAGSISLTGNTANYNTTSDERLKENIADSTDAGSKIDAIQIRQFDWKADGSHQDYGVIAQELVEVAPEAVHQPVDEEDKMGVDYSKLVPMLIKEVQSLRSRVAELENK